MPKKDECTLSPQILYKSFLILCWILGSTRISIFYLPSSAGNSENKEKRTLITYIEQHYTKRYYFIPLGAFQLFFYIFLKNRSFTWSWLPSGVPSRYSLPEYRPHQTHNYFPLINHWLESRWVNGLIMNGSEHLRNGGQYTYQTTRYNIPKDSHIHMSPRETEIS